MSVAVDMHCHLDLYPDPMAEIDALAKSRAYVLSVTTTPSAWVRTAQLAKALPRVQTALGLHPQLAAERRNELALFDRLLGETRYVGEVGLDGSAGCRSFWEDQVHVFEYVLRACKQAGGRVLSIHSRGAASEVLDCLEREPEYGVAILHWFTGTPKQLDRAIDLGCWFSVGPAMLVTKNGRRLVQTMPRDRVLTETDGPFAKQEATPLRPAQCANAIEQIALLWGASNADAQDAVLENFRTLASQQYAKGRS
jgi:TatD DNase family protein